MTAAMLSLAASFERDMRNTEHTAPDVTIRSCREMIKSMVMSMEDDIGAKSTARKLGKIVSEFAVYGDSRPHIHFSMPASGFIWVFLQIIDRATSHKVALDTIREIQSEYCDQVRAMEKFHSH